MAGSLALGSPWPAAAAAAPLTRMVATIDRAGALAALDAAISAADRLHAPCAIAVVDPDGTLVAFESLDGSRAASPDLAIGKARTAARLQRPTAEIEDRTNGGRVAFVTAGLMALRGGVPLAIGGTAVGAIGVAGLNKDNDVAIATEAAAAFATEAGRAPADTR